MCWSIDVINLRELIVCIPLAPKVFVVVFAAVFVVPPDGVPVGVGVAQLGDLIVFFDRVCTLVGVADVVECDDSTPGVGDGFGADEGVFGTDDR